MSSFKPNKFYIIHYTVGYIYLYGWVSRLCIKQHITHHQADNYAMLDIIHNTLYRYWLGINNTILFHPLKPYMT